jgi:hypothetical protein
LASPPAAEFLSTSIDSPSAIALAASAPPPMTCLPFHRSYAACHCCWPASAKIACSCSGPATAPAADRSSAALYAAASCAGSSRPKLATIEVDTWPLAPVPPFVAALAPSARLKLIVTLTFQVLSFLFSTTLKTILPPNLALAPAVMPPWVVCVAPASPPT